MAQAFFQAPIASALVGPTGSILEANKAFEELVGADAKALRGSSILDIIHREEHEAALLSFASALGGGAARSEAERRYLHASGAVVQVQESLALLRADEGAPAYLILQAQDVNGRREAATALQGREARLRLLVEQIPAVLWTTDTELRLTSGLGRRLDLFGLRPKETGPSLFEYFNTQDPESAAIVAHRRALAGESVTLEVDWLERTFRTHVEPLRDEGGSAIVGTIGVASDVTELKQTEDALRTSEKKFRSLAESMSAATFIFQGPRLVYANAAARAITGFEQEELAQMSFWEVIHPIDRERVRQNGSARQRGEAVPNRYEVRILTKGGEERWVDYTGGTIEYQGEPAVLGTAFDITERKLAEAALHVGEERFRAIFEKSPVGMAVGDGRLRLLDVNSALCRMMGYQRDELLGLTVGDVSHPAELARNLGDLEDLVRVDAPVIERERRFVRKSGDAGWFRTTASAIRDETGTPIYWLAMIEDVTEQRRSEAEARAHRAELGRVLRLRSMGELAAGLAHELNQPLAAVVSFAKGCVHRLKSGELSSEDLIEKLDQIAREALRAGSIIHWVQRFLRKEAPRLEPVDIVGLVANIVRLVEPEARQRGIEIRLRLPSDLPQVPAESVQIEQVLFNLVRNGLDAIEEQNGEAAEVEIAAHVAGSMLEVAVRDTACGLGPGDPERVFEPFYSTKPEGMGLGLSISRSIIEAQGGRLWLSKTGPGGTEFRFSLPIGPERAG